MGVSDPGQVLQRVLGTTTHRCEHFDGSADFPASIAACLSAHEPDRKHTFRQSETDIGLGSSTFLDEYRITANSSKHENCWGSRSGVVGGSRPVPLLD